MNPVTQGSENSVTQYASSDGQEWVVICDVVRMPPLPAVQYATGEQERLRPQECAG